MPEKLTEQGKKLPSASSDRNRGYYSELDTEKGEIVWVKFNDGQYLSHVSCKKYLSVYY